MRPKQLTTVVGPITIQRPYYVCGHCHQGQSPRDAEWDVEGTAYSPGVRRMMALVGSDTSLDHGREQLAVLAGLEVTTKAVERHAEAIGADIAAGEQRAIGQAIPLDLPVVVGEPIPILYVQMDGTGIPVVKKETEGRQGKIDGQPAHTREVQLGCVFTQTTWDQKGYAIRDADSTTYTGAIETAEEFGKRLYLEAWNRGWSHAAKKVVMGDGAEWIWNLADQHFPGAVQIVDLYHARQHLWDLARRLYPNDFTNQQAWRKVHQKRLLDKGKIEKLVLAIRSLQSTNPEVPEKIRTEADYFARHAERMRYPKVPPSPPVHRLRCDRGWLQNRNRLPPKAVWHVPDDSRRQLDHRLTLLSSQPSFRGLLAGSPRRLTSTLSGNPLSALRRRGCGDELKTVLAGFLFQ
jgi:hypothetical protein